MEAFPETFLAWDIWHTWQGMADMAANPENSWEHPSCRATTWVKSWPTFGTFITLSSGCKQYAVLLYTLATTTSYHNSRRVLIFWVWRRLWTGGLNGLLTRPDSCARREIVALFESHTIDYRIECYLFFYFYAAQLAKLARSAKKATISDGRGASRGGTPTVKVEKSFFFLILRGTAGSIHAAKPYPCKCAYKLSANAICLAGNVDRWQPCPNFSC